MNCTSRTIKSLSWAQGGNRNLQVEPSKYITHTIHVGYIEACFLNGKCTQTHHTWMVFVICRPCVFWKGTWFEHAGTAWMVSHLRVDGACECVIDLSSRLPVTSGHQELAGSCRKSRAKPCRIGFRSSQCALSLWTPRAARAAVAALEQQPHRRRTRFSLGTQLPAEHGAWIVADATSGRWLWLNDDILNIFNYVSWVHLKV